MSQINRDRDEVAGGDGARRVVGRGLVRRPACRVYKIPARGRSRRAAPQEVWLGIVRALRRCGRVGRRQGPGRGGRWRGRGGGSEEVLCGGHRVLLT